MNVRKAALTVAVLLIGTMCFAQNPNMGTWKLNEAKSKLAAGLPKNTSVRYEAAGDSTKATVDGVDVYKRQGSARRRFQIRCRRSELCRRDCPPGHGSGDLAVPNRRDCRQSCVGPVSYTHLRYDLNEYMAFKAELDHTVRRDEPDLNGLQLQWAFTF